MIIYALEDLRDVREEVLALFAQQWRETEHWRGTEFRPDEDRFRRLCEAGHAFCASARDDGRLVGGIILLVGMDILDSTMYAQEMGFFVEPAYRKGTVAFRLVSKALELLDKLPLSRIMFADKHPVGGESLERFLPKFGFSMVSRIYVRL